MTCLAKIEGNPACLVCEIQNLIKQDGWGSNYLQKDRIPQGVHITTKPKDAMAGMPARQIVRCNRGLGIPINGKEPEEQVDEPEFIKELRESGFKFGKVDHGWKPKGRNAI